MDDVCEEAYYNINTLEIVKSYFVEENEELHQNVRIL